jgi:5-methylcytosine-specific restriction endonuclease McrA
MIIIDERINKTVKNRITISNDNPSPKTYASYVLLKQSLFDISEPPYMIWLNVREKFLTKKLKEEGELVCEFCGKRHMEIGYTKPSELDRNNYNDNQATIDHLLAKSNYPHFEFEEFNFAISCKKCNSKKSNLSLEEWIEKNPQSDWYSFFDKHQEVLKYVPSLNKYQLELC